MAPLPATPMSKEERTVRQYTVKNNQTFTIGAFVLLDGTPEITECGADPAVILGISAEGMTAVAGTSKDPETPKILVYVAGEKERFWMAGTSNPVAGDVNVKYGIVKDASGIWVVDKTDAVNTRVYVHKVDLVRNLFLVSVLEANRQVAP